MGPALSLRHPGLYVGNLCFRHSFQLDPPTQPLFMELLKHPGDVWLRFGGVVGTQSGVWALCYQTSAWNMRVACSTHALFHTLGFRHSFQLDPPTQPIFMELLIYPGDAWPHRRITRVVSASCSLWHPGGSLSPLKISFKKIRVDFIRHVHQLAEGYEIRLFQLHWDSFGLIETFELFIAQGVRRPLLCSALGEPIEGPSSLAPSANAGPVPSGPGTTGTVDVHLSEIVTFAWLSVNAVSTSLPAASTGIRSENHYYHSSCKEFQRRDYLK